MIGWLKGDVLHKFKSGNKNLILIACGGIGYEVRLIQRDWATVQSAQPLERWIHHTVTPEAHQLFGFDTAAERDLFRTLIGVSGVGPQAGLAILDACEPDNLITALVNGDTRTLSRAQGVGKRTAERLVLELRAKFVSDQGMQTEDLAQINAAQRELFATLETLGYEPSEIRQALEQIESEQILSDEENADAWLRACIQVMSREGR